MVTKFLKGFYIKSENVLVEVWGKYNNDTITSYSIKIHQSTVGYSASYETLEEVEKAYKNQVETFKNNNVKHFEEKEEVCDRYNELLKEVKKEVEEVNEEKENENNIEVVSELVMLSIKLTAFENNTSIKNDFKLLELTAKLKDDVSELLEVLEERQEV